MRALVVVVASLAVVGCGDSSVSSQRTQNRDLVAHRVKVFNVAYDQFDGAIQQAEGLSEGACRSAIRDLTSSIAALRAAIETFRADASAARFDRLNDEAHLFVKAHDASVKAMERTEHPC